ncbi:MAG: hypothetical protein ACRD1U_18865, partial [Vicinamibacterales bacterium]
MIRTRSPRAASSEQRTARNEQRPANSGPRQRACLILSLAVAITGGSLTLFAQQPAPQQPMSEVALQPLAQQVRR